jgi:hypothetical protein
VYDVMADPPSLAGADQVKDTLVPEAVPATPVGAPGAVATSTPDDAADGRLPPAELVATTVNVYVTPKVSPVTGHDVPAVEHVNPPGDEVARYEVIAAPPLYAGATHETVTVVPAATPDTAVGASGAIAGTATPEDAADCEPEPTAFVAATLNVYVVPRDSPVMSHVAAGGAPLDVHVKPPGDEVAV